MTVWSMYSESDAGGFYINSVVSRHSLPKIWVKSIDKLLVDCYADDRLETLHTKTEGDFGGQ